jgi:hypothetical protein
MNKEDFIEYIKCFFAGLATIAIAPFVVVLALPVLIICFIGAGARESYLMKIRGQYEVDEND